MRSTHLLLSSVVAACTSSSSPPPNDLVPETPDRVDAMTCPAPVDVCVPCNQTLDAALHDPRLCGPGFPGVMEECDDFIVVHKSEIDTATAYYYRDGQLTAVVGDGPNNHFGCMAGPSMVVLPHCQHEHAIPLPQCGSH